MHISNLNAGTSFLYCKDTRYRLTAETGPYLDFSEMYRDTETHTLWKQGLSLHLSWAETEVKVFCELCSLTLPAESISEPLFNPFTCTLVCSLHLLPFLLFLQTVCKPVSAVVPTSYCLATRSQVTLHHHTLCIMNWISTPNVGMNMCVCVYRYICFVFYFIIRDIYFKVSESGHIFYIILFYLLFCWGYLI